MSRLLRHEIKRLWKHWGLQHPLSELRRELQLAGRDPIWLEVLVKAPSCSRPYYPTIRTKSAVDFWHEIGTAVTAVLRMIVPGWVCQHQLIISKFLLAENRMLNFYYREAA